MRAKQKRAPTPPRKRLSPPMTSIANGDKRRRASASIDKRRPNGPIANGDAVDHEERFGGQNGRHSQKNSFRSAGAGPTAVPPTRQLGSNSSSAQINQFLTYALRTLTPIGARTAHAIKFIGKQTKRRKAHGERYHERRKQNRELHGRPLSANAKAPIVCSPREFRERIKPLSTSAGKVQFVRIIMSHERKTHAERRSKMKFNF